jgi:hypothetical protein
MLGRPSILLQELVHGLRDYIFRVDEKPVDVKNAGGEAGGSAG